MVGGGFVIWTRYVNPRGTVIRHAYGPYETRAKAQTALKRMLREAEANLADYHSDGILETFVTNLIGDSHV